MPDTEGESRNSLARAVFIHPWVRCTTSEIPAATGASAPISSAESTAVARLRLPSP
jgi:hypothetical protein